MLQLFLRKSVQNDYETAADDAAMGKSLTETKRDEISPSKYSLCVCVCDDVAVGTL